MGNQENQNNRKLDSECISKIASYMRVGADFLLASAACEVPEALAKEWQVKAAAAHELNEIGMYLDLYEAIRTASAHAEVIALQRLSAEGGAAGAKWLLEKLRPQKYGTIQKQPANKKASTGEFEEWQG
jgi:hypothetical protein